MAKPSNGIYAETITRAAMLLLAMSYRPDLEASLVNEVAAAVEARGGRIDGKWFVRFDLRAVFEEIVERAMAILSAAVRQRLPGIADEMDEAFGDQLRILLASAAKLLPTL
ncbi:MAG: hypothetical protein ABSE22_05360 [Xanthobacteraceae bacterium]|jgi:hypothetical protein